MQEFTIDFVVKTGTSLFQNHFKLNDSFEYSVNNISNESRAITIALYFGQGQGLAFEVVC